MPTVPFTKEADVESVNTEGQPPWTTRYQQSVQTKTSNKGLHTSSRYYSTFILYEL